MRRLYPALYSLLIYLLMPLVVLRMFWKGFELNDYHYRWAERFGFVKPIAGGVAVWVHAVSVGESLAALPLIRALIEKHGPQRVLVTTISPTGSARIAEIFKDSIQHCYLPFDMPGAVSRFLGRVHPQQVVIMETELWPNLYQALHRHSIPLFIASARMSARSVQNYGRVKEFAAQTLAACRGVAAQTELDAQRFRDLGAPNVSVMGNIKFDLQVPEAQVELGQALRAQLGATRPVWIAASTHEGEEEAALVVQHDLLKHFPEALLILVPRHPQRFDAIVRLMQKSGLRVARRSQWTPEAPAPQILVGDSMGEMFMYFAAADVAFVGGSLVTVGGHNVLEPAALGLPVLFGPHMDNFQQARDLLLQAKAGVQCAGRAQLAEALRPLLLSSETRRQMGEAGREAVSANRGALQRLLALLS